MHRSFMIHEGAHIVFIFFSTGKCSIIVVLKQICASFTPEFKLSCWGLERQ